jgi:hypothetical protein
MRREATLRSRPPTASLTTDNMSASAVAASDGGPGTQYGDPFFFLSTPSLYADPGVLAAAGSTTVQINVASDFEWFATASREGRHAHETARIAQKILAAVERRLLPDLRRHRVV